MLCCSIKDTYDHRLKRTGHPVRSAIHKLHVHRIMRQKVDQRWRSANYPHQHLSPPEVTVLIRMFPKYLSGGWERMAA